ncbi:MAG: hypothetical protein LBL34_01220 [Clostridiales bacterium]|jgi:DNA-binding XRE family transcriptional regulator|nr:hypothetical protein [Clostridiales bacterium]
MFPNLMAEQARYEMTDSRAGEILGMSRMAYWNKKKTGKLTVLEAKKLCETFNVSFDYLFSFDASKTEGD